MVIVSMETSTTSEIPSLNALQKLRNPKLIRSFASDAELEDALHKEAERTGYSMSEIIRKSLRSALLSAGS